MAVKNFRLRIYHDHFTEGVAAVLSPERRVIFCVAGDASVFNATREEKLAADGAWFSDTEVKVGGEQEGARLWRWELVEPDAEPGEIHANGVKSVNAGDYEIEIDVSIKRLMRLDRVSFPLGGEALTHVHAAAGVRCLETGNLLLESLGKRYRVWPGDSWVEHGPDRVYAK